MNIIAETTRMYLRLLEESDLELVEKWWNDGNITGPMGFPNGIGITKEVLYKRFKNQFVEKNQMLNSRMYIIYSKELNKPIGEIQYGEADMDKKSCRLGMKIGELSAQGKGLGKEALICFMQYLFDKLKMDTILIDSFPENLPAYNLYKNVGFIEVETLKDFWKDETNKSHDLIMMELKKSNWKLSLRSTKHFKVIYCRDDLELGCFIIDNIDCFYTKICNSFSIPVSSNFNFTIVISDSIDNYIKYTGKTKSEYQSWMVGFSDLETRTICILSPRIAEGYSSEEMIQILKHEIVHAVFDDYHGAIENEAWISEGVALLYAGQVDLKHVEEAIPIVKIQGKMVNENTPDNFVNNGGYDVAGVYVYYFIHKYGFEKFSKAYTNEIDINQLIYPNFEFEAIEFYKKSFENH